MLIELASGTRDFAAASTPAFRRNDGLPIGSCDPVWGPGGTLAEFAPPLRPGDAVFVQVAPPSRGTTDEAVYGRWERGVVAFPLGAPGTAAARLRRTASPEENERIAQANARDLAGLGREYVERVTENDPRRARILEIMFGKAE
jgi:hypothetical protein